MDETFGGENPWILLADAIWDSDLPYFHPCEFDIPQL